MNPEELEDHQHTEGTTPRVPVGEAVDKDRADPPAYSIFTSQQEDMLVDWFFNHINSEFKNCMKRDRLLAEVCTMLNGWDPLSGIGSVPCCPCMGSCYDGGKVDRRLRVQSSSLTLGSVSITLFIYLPQRYFLTLYAP